jgi:hypothetical protein
VNNSACPAILSPETLVCSGRGVCTSNGCQCDLGWEGLGDFAFGKSCSINVNAVRGLWATAAAVQVLVFFHSIYYLFRKRKQFNSVTSTALWVGILTCSHSIFLVTSSLIRATHVETLAVGSDRTLTALMTLGMACFWTSQHLTIFTFVYFQLKQAAKGFLKNDLEKQVFRLRVYIPASAAIAVVGCLLPLGMLAATNETDVFVYGILHYLILAMVIFNCAFIYLPALVRPLESDIEKAINADSGNAAVASYKQILSKLKQFRTELRNTAIPNVCCAVIFGSWPFLQSRASSYWLPIAWLSAGYALTKDLQMLMPVSSSSEAPGAANASGISSSKQKEGKVGPSQPNNENVNNENLSASATIPDANGKSFQVAVHNNTDVDASS